MPKNITIIERKCKCGLHIIPTPFDGVRWYWGRHAVNECTMELPNLRCWCGRLRSEHQDKFGHDPLVSRVILDNLESGPIV